MPTKRPTKKTISKKPVKKRSKKNVSLITTLSGRKFRPLLFGLLFGLVGITYLIVTRAATPSISLEIEVANLVNNCASIVSDTNASAGKAVKFQCPTNTGFVHPGVVYTRADIDSWSTSSPEYTRLAGTGAGSLTNTSSRFVPIVYGTQIDSGADVKDATNELNAGLKDQSGFAKVQAVLWAADGNSARRDKVIAYLKEFGTVTSFQWDSIEQYRLVAGWGCTNLAQAAEIINYQDAGFRRFLKEECYPIMDWTAGPNWHASFADSKLAIAAYLGDTELWSDAKSYFYERIKQSFYHSAYDGNKAFPMHNEDRQSAVLNSSGVKIGSTVDPRLHAPPGAPKLGSTRQHWGGQYDTAGVGQVNDDYTLNTKYGNPINGINAERLRDYGHVSMGLGAWMHGARTILAQGEQLEKHAYDRLLTGYDYHSGNVLSYAQTGTFPSPAPTQGDGGGSRFQGYYGAKRLFGATTPQTVLNMLSRSEVTTYAAGGANHMVAEAFADSTSGTTSALPSTGVVTGQLNAPTSKSYRLWVRMNVPDSTNNAVQAQMDAGVSYKMGDSQIPANTWVWVDYHSGDTTKKVDLNLAQGDHTLTLTGIEPGVKVDRALILDNTTCIPSGTGENCVSPPNVPPTVSLTYPTANSGYTSPASITISANASDADGTVSKVEFYNGTTKLGEDTTAPYGYTWVDVGSGSYSLSAKAFDNNSASTTSGGVNVTVNSPPPPAPASINAPTNFRVQSTGNGKVTLTWDKSTDSRVDLYMLRYTNANSSTVTNYSTWTYPAKLADNTITISGLKNGNTYYFQVRALDTVGTESSSDDILGSYTNSISAKPTKKYIFF